MSQKIDSPEFARGFVWQLGLVSMVILSIVVFSPKLFRSAKQNPVQQRAIVLFPWAVAGGQTIENGLLAFSGKPAEPTPGNDQIRALAGLLIVAVFCPTLFLLRWRRRKIAQPASAEPEPWRLSRVLYGVVAAITILWAVGIPLVTITSEIVRGKLREAQAVQSNRDEIINDMNMISFNVAQFYILPKDLGGGARSMMGYGIPNEMKTNENASYAATVYGKNVRIHASSKSYSDCWVEAKSDTTGHLSEWVYGGKFQ